MSRIVTLLTDFGISDHYVAAMKGQILARAPEAKLVDITHDIQPGDIQSAAYLLSSCRNDFPKGTVHLAVVDPGVGSKRRPMALEANSRYYVGPDNGIFTLVARAADEPRTRELTRQDLFNSPVSNTFHGRDIFAPVAGSLAAGLAFDQVGSRLADPQELHIPDVSIQKGEIRGTVLHVDRFGNVITDISDNHLRWAEIDRNQFGCEIGNHRIEEVRKFYAGSEDKSFLLIGSGSLVEISCNGNSAADLLGVGRGDDVLVYRVK